MVLCDVEHRRRDGFQARRRLELEAGQLDDECVRPGRSLLVRGEYVEHGFADVAYRHRVQPSRAQQVGDQRGDGRLAVGAGHGQDFLARRQRTGEKLDVAHQLGSTLDGGANRRLILGESGADDDHLRTGERRVGNRPGRNLNLRQLGGELRGARWIAAGIGNRDARAATCSPARRRQPGRSEAQHDDVAIPQRHRQRSFNVERPNRTRSMVMIQNLTTTWFSFHPFSS
jgi:hypothetical protein